MYYGNESLGLTCSQLKVYLTNLFSTNLQFLNFHHPAKWLNQDKSQIDITHQNCEQ